MQARALRTLIRLGAPPELAEKISLHITATAFDGITTKEIFTNIKENLKEYKDIIAMRRDLRSALGIMKPKPDFEEYVRLVLREHGYKVTSDKVIHGSCVTHEIDGIAEKSGVRYCLEVKNHENIHSYTPFEITLSAKAKLDDLNEGYRKGVNNEKLDKVLIVCNTRLTEHATKYADCVGLEHIGWNVPKGRGFEILIEEKMLYPVTMLEGLTEKERDQLSKTGILTLKQLIKASEKVIDTNNERMREFIINARNILKLINI